MINDESHLTSLFENATEGFVVTGPEGDIVLVNPSACRMFGYSPGELIGQKVEILLPGSAQQGHIKMRDGFYKDPHNRVMGHGRDLYGQSKNGDKFPVEVSLSTYTHKGKRHVTAFIVDISHRKSIEKNMLLQQQQLEKVTDEIRNLNAELEGKVEERTIILKEALQRLEQSQLELNEALKKEKQLNEIKSRFVSMASHEFRTPLSTVLSSASLLSKYTAGDEQEKRNRHINKIRASVKHLNDLLEDFLSLGKLDEGKMGINASEFSFPELIHETIEELKVLSKEGQEINYLHEGIETINTDKRMMKNILINIISNALKFSQPGATVEIQSRVNESSAQVAVSDKGIGISEDDLDHLFTSFFRGKNAVNIQGTGLGLHIVKRYADLLKGKLDISSELNKGTNIMISIPVNHS